jgi:hypothetical protein
MARLFLLVLVAQEEEATELFAPEQVLAAMV